MAKLLHADLVVPTAAFGSSECGVRNLSMAKSASRRRSLAGLPYALAKGRAAADAE
jgi:hypothetical protein